MKERRKRKRIHIQIALIALTLFPAAAFGQNVGNPLKSELFHTVYQAVAATAGALTAGLAIIAILAGAYMYLMTVGDTERIQKAKRIIKYAIIAIVIALLLPNIFLILKSIGIDLTPVAEAPPVCGDNWCNGSETCSSCPQDCGACAPTPTPAPTPVPTPTLTLWDCGSGLCFCSEAPPGYSNCSSVGSCQTAGSAACPAPTPTPTPTPAPTPTVGNECQCGTNQFYCSTSCTSCVSTGNTCDLAQAEKDLSSSLVPTCGGTPSCGGVGSCDSLNAGAAGGPMPVCFSGCTSATSCNLDQNVRLNTQMLYFVDAMQKSGYSFITSSVTTGSHSATSKHYTGDAMDLVKSGGTTYQQLESALLNAGATFVQCELGGSKVPCTNVSIDHIHVEYKR